MKKKILQKPIAIAAILSAGLAWSGLSVAALDNGDFSSGFTSWESQNDFSDFNPAINNENFDVSSGAAVLTTDYNAAGSFLVTLAQVFTLQTNSLTLGFDFTWITGETDNYFTAQMLGIASGDLLFFNDVSSIDISNFAGQEVELSFALENVSGIDGSVSIDNITITRSQAQNNNVPEPATILLIGAGVTAMRRKSITSWVSSQTV